MPTEIILSYTLCSTPIVEYVFSALKDPFKMPFTFSVSAYAYMVYAYVYYGW